MIECENVLMVGGAIVMPTDTLYGVLASALDPLAVENIYKLKKRDNSKPCIVLISHKESLSIFDIDISEEKMNELDTYWPGPNTIILPCLGDKFKYLHKGTEALAFRVPDNEELRRLIEKVGPVIAPSANIEGEKPAETIEEAKKYFGKGVLCYYDGGVIKGKASKIISFIEDGKVLRD